MMAQVHGSAYITSLCQAMLGQMWCLSSFCVSLGSKGSLLSVQMFMSSSSLSGCIRYGYCSYLLGPIYSPHQKLIMNCGFPVYFLKIDNVLFFKISGRF